jgi:hypothetical protein
MHITLLSPKAARTESAANQMQIIAPSYPPSVNSHGSNSQKLMSLAAKKPK